MARCTCFRDGSGRYAFCMEHPFGTEVRYNEPLPPTLDEVLRRLDAQKKVIESLATSIIDLEDQLRALTAIVDLHLRNPLP